jgi:hypothetical protein
MDERKREHIADVAEIQSNYEMVRDQVKGYMSKISSAISI